MHAREALEAAPDIAPAAPVRAARALAAGLSAPIASKTFGDLTQEYAAWFEACAAQPQYQANVAYYVKRLNQGKAVYDAVGKDLGIPWAFVGVVHGMECGFNFAAHLHNGDPLTARTVNVPAGRPKSGTPPFTWKQSALDALTYMGYHDITDWSTPRMLFLLEKYNGFGYRMRRAPTPYLWSFSNLYSKGKFVKDGNFDPEAVSKQCGAALMLKAVFGKQ
jgi:lysozyme family protein